MSVRRGSLLAAVAIATAALGIMPSMSSAAPAAPAAPAAALADDATGTYYPRAQTRLLDTRSGVGSRGLLRPGAEISLVIAGKAFIPASGASAVVLNLTGVGASGETYLTAYPSGTVRPSVSSLNLPKGSTRANLVTVPIGADGRIRIFNGSASVHVLADVVGFYAKDSSTLGAYGMGHQFQLLAPGRLVDTRQDLPFAPGERASFQIDFGDPTANANMRALTLNITATGATKGGFLRAWNGATGAPAASTLNFAAGQTVPNMAIVPTRSMDGLPTFDLQNDSSGLTDVIIDVVGAYDTLDPQGLRYAPVTPVRIVDTRSGTGGYGTPFAADTTRTFTTPVGVAGVDTAALVANTTAVRPTASTFLSVWSTGDSQPGVSNLNAAPNQVVANATITPMSMGNQFDVYNYKGNTTVLMDVAGTFEIFPATPALAAPHRTVSADRPLLHWSPVPR